MDIWLHYLSIVWFYVALWPVDVSAFVGGALTGILLPVRSSAWRRPAVLFLAWGFLFEIALFVGVLFTPYSGEGSYSVHIAFMLYRIPFAAGMVGGIVATGQRKRRHGTTP